MKKNTVIFRGEVISLNRTERDYLRLQFRHRGKLIRKHLGKFSRERKKYAIAICRKIDADLLWGKFKTLDDYFDPKNENEKEKTFLELWAHFLEHRKNSNLKIQTLRQDNDIDRHIQKIGKKIIIPIDRQNAIKIQKALEEITTLEMTRRSLNRIAQCLDFFELDSEPIRRLSRKITPSWTKNQNTPIALSDDEIKKLLTEIEKNPDHHPKKMIFLFWVYTGCRPSQALAIRRKDLDFEKDTIFFRGSFQLGKFQKGSKKNQEYSIPISVALKKNLQTYTEENNFLEEDLIFPFSQNLRSYDRFFRFCSKVLGKKITAYNLRDTFISAQVLKGVPLAVIAKWVNSSVTEIEKKYFSMVNSEYKP